MQKKFVAAALIFGPLALTSCQSKQARTAKLQVEYNHAHKQYYNDCVAPAFGGTDSYFKNTKPKTPTHQQEAAQQQKCAQEAKRAGDLEKQLQAASQ